MIFRFYFFNFLAYFKRKNLDTIPWFRAILLVSLTYIILLLVVVGTLRNIFFPNLSFNLFRLILLFFDFNILYVCYLNYVKAGKDELIMQEFTDHPLNTKTNRIWCWIIFVLSFLLLYIPTLIKKL